MKHSKIIGSVVLLLCLYLISFADKVVKTGTILNSNCNPIGSRCGSTGTNKDATMTYAYNEPRQGSFSLQFTEAEVLKNEKLAMSLVDKDEFEMEEAMPIPDDVIEALHMPENLTIAKGVYPIVYAKGVYSIIIHK